MGDSQSRELLEHLLKASPSFLFTMIPVSFSGRTLCTSVSILESGMLYSSEAILFY
jgi:hypothetical protein